MVPPAGCSATGTGTFRMAGLSSSVSRTPCWRREASRRLFGEFGYRGTSVRAITSLAGANLAAVAYHIGSKAELMAAVARRVIEPITTAQRARLDELLARTEEPAVADLVEAFAGPLFDEMPADDAGKARKSRLIVTILSDPAEEARSWSGPDEDAVRERYLTAFTRALPGLAPKSCGSGCGESLP